MRIGLVALSLFTLAAAVAEAAADGVFEHGERVALWPDGAPEGKGSGPEDTPSVAIHFPAAENATGTAIIVNPGGGYRGLASYHEGTQIARWLNQVGITAMILRYRLMPRYHTSAALLDAQRAVRFVRHHAERIGISTSRIGMMGFSAGGHLTTWAGTDFAAGNPTDRDPINRQSSRPDFLVPVYPGTSASLLGPEERKYIRSTDVLVTEETPPTFLVHAYDDPMVTSAHSTVFFQALLDAGVPAEIHVFSSGGHGGGLGAGDPIFGQWPELAMRWMRRNGLLTDAPRVSVSGNVRLDGKPFPFGRITFIPDDDRKPTIAAQLYPGKKGAFTITERYGPSVGKYQVEVRRLFANMSTRDGGSPPKAGSETFRTVGPDSSDPIDVEFYPGNNEVMIELESAAANVEK